MAIAERGERAALAVGLIAVELAWSAAPQQWQRLHLQLPAGSTALTALRASGLAGQLGAALLDSLTLALWGRAIPPETCAMRNGAAPRRPTALSFISTMS